MILIIRGLSRNSLSAILQEVSDRSGQQTADGNCDTDAVARTTDREEKEVRTIIVPDKMSYPRCLGRFWNKRNQKLRRQLNGKNN